MEKPVKLTTLLKAKPGVSKEDFKRHCLEEYSPLVLKLRKLKGYRINIAIDEYEDKAGESTYDGTAELCWDSINDMKKDLASNAGAELLADADSCMQKTHIYLEEHTLLNVTAEI
jgi:uncharacterized protein (TIGR02118 family)